MSNTVPPWNFTIEKIKMVTCCLFVLLLRSGYSKVSATGWLDSHTLVLLVVCRVALLVPVLLYPPRKLSIPIYTSSRTAGLRMRSTHRRRGCPFSRRWWKSQVNGEGSYLNGGRSFNWRLNFLVRNLNARWVVL